MTGSVPELPGERLDGDWLHVSRREVAELLNRHSLGFPGAQPVSFTSKHLLELQKQDYYLCEKSDGIRCLMYLTEDEEHNEVVYLIDRKNDYYHVPYLHFPLSIDREQDFHIGTLVDGELVNDKQPDGSVKLNYLVFDCLALDHADLMHRTLDKRLAYFIDHIYNPYKALCRKYPEDVHIFPFQIQPKPFELAYGVEMMFKEKLPKLPHGNDGLIFTCRTTPYQHGTDQHILKWKFDKDNSVDFRLFFEWPMIEPDAEDMASGDAEPYPDYYQKPTFHLAAHCGNNEDRLFGKLTVEDEEWEEWKALQKPLDERIVECTLDKQGRWRFYRWREDKHDANHTSVVHSVIESIQDGVSEEQLIQNSRKVRDEHKKREAEEKAKVAAAQRAAAGPVQTNGHREVSVKRKFEGEEDGNDEKRIRAP